MDIIFKGYTKTVEDKLYYFIKRYQRFPDLPGLDDIQEAFGMHTDFDKACEIAGLFDNNIKITILAEIESLVPTAKVIDLTSVDLELKKLGSQ